jgi:2-C-methyl-D-erythritol 2,4-cyclodiphosphate synthase
MPPPTPKPARARIGHGYDLHRLEPRTPAGEAKPLVIGGVVLESPVGPVAHSDGDVLYHATVDALMGALALPDIGQMFPDNAPSNKGRNSEEFLTHAVTIVRRAGYALANLDATVILERPRLSPVKDQVRANLARCLGVDISAVNIKGKSHERVDAVGEGRAVEAHVVVLLERDMSGSQSTTTQARK